MTDPSTIAALLLLGFILITVEVLVVPGVGIPGVLGTILAGVGCYFAWTGHGAGVGVATIVGSVALSLLLSWWMMRSRTGRRLVLTAAMDGQSSSPADSVGWVGRVGVVRTPLRPAGVVELGDERFDATAEGGAWIDAEQRVQVVRAWGKELVVRELETGGEEIG